MTYDQAANAILDMFKTRYRVVDENGKEVCITNLREQAALMAEICKGDYIAIQS